MIPSTHPVNDLRVLPVDPRVGPLAPARWTPARTPRPAPVPRLGLVEAARPLPLALRDRDPRLIRRIFPAVARVVDAYFRAEVEGVEHLRDRAALMACTHNGGLYMPDLLAVMVAFWRRFGLNAPSYGLMHSVVFRAPWLGDLARGVGALPAKIDNARAVLESGYPLAICPGGDVDSLKPFRDRHKIRFGGRRGFIRLALECQVPIVPVVSVGAHEIFFVLNDGRALARRLWIARKLRIKTVPLSLSVPFGLTPAGLLAFPLPSKVRVRVLPPIELAEPPSAAGDPEAVERCFRHVEATMQRALDDLAARRRHVLLG